MKGLLNVISVICGEWAIAAPSAAAPLFPIFISSIIQSIINKTT